MRLSGGQRQRLSIARALLKDAPILVLDEATSWVDRASESAIQAAIERLSSGRTVVRVTHRLADLDAFDRILVLEQGRLVESGTERELLALGGAFARLRAGDRGGDGLGLDASAEDAVSPASIRQDARVLWDGVPT